MNNYYYNNSDHSWHFSDTPCQVLLQVPQQSGTICLHYIYMSSVAGTKQWRGEVTFPISLTLYHSQRHEPWFPIQSS